MDQLAKHVVLEAIQVANTGEPRQDLAFFRILPDGTYNGAAPTGFQVPQGQVLIITDVDWQYAGNPGTVQTLRIFIQPLTSPGMTAAPRVFESTITLNQDGQGGISEAMTTGFVVSSQMRMTVDTYPGGGKIQHVLLRGHLLLD